MFGLNRRTVELLAAQAENQRDELEAAYLTLSSNVVMAAVQEAGLRAEIAAQQQTINADQELEHIIAHQYAVGEVAQAELLQQQSVLAQAQQLLPPLQRQLDMQENALIALSGGYPNEVLPETFDLAQLHLPQTLPVSLPSALVAQRPDILAAAANMHAASAEIGVAIANRLPQFPLTAQFGTSPAAIANAFTPYNQFFTVAAGLATPLFDGGTLKHKQRAAVAQFDYAAAMYKQTVIGAFQNVSDTLRALQTDADQLQAAQTADNAARQNLGDRPHRIAGRCDCLLLGAECRADVPGGPALAGTGGDDAPHRYGGLVPGSWRRLVEPHRPHRRADDRGEQLGSPP